jgi:peptide/nickel transport system permease protein
MTTRSRTGQNLWMILRNLLHSLGITLRIMSYNKVGFAGFLGVVIIVLFSYLGPTFVELDTHTKIDQISPSPSAR